MNFDQAKTLRLQRWRAHLDDQDFRMQNPEGHRETLHEMAATLRDEGLIDQLEQFDMNEMANAAYWHAAEELQSSPGHYRGASTYDVFQIDNESYSGRSAARSSTSRMTSLAVPPSPMTGRSTPIRTE